MIDDTKWLYNGLYIICIRLSIEHSRDLWTRTGYAFFMFFLPSSRSWLGCHFANQICTVFNDSEAPWYIYIGYSTHIYTLLCTSIYFYIQHSSINLLHFVDLLPLWQIHGVSKLWIGWLKFWKSQVVSLRGMWWFFIFRLSPATFAGRAAATLTNGLGRPLHVQ